jgi:hypothetical protein
LISCAEYHLPFCCSLPLFTFSTGLIEKKGDTFTSRGSAQQSSLVTVHTGNPEAFPLEGNTPNELIARLSTDLISQEGDSTVFRVLFERAAVVVFLLEHVSSSSHASQPFSYPATFYMDQFLAKNLELADSCRSQRKDMQAETSTLLQRKLAITSFGVSILALLHGRITLNSYERVKTV